MANRSEFDLYETSFASPDDISPDYSREDQIAKGLNALSLQTESSVLLPSAEFLTDAALVRQNEDLVLRLPDGSEMVVEGYFAADPRPTLTLADGVSVLTPELVQSFLQESIFAGEGSATATDSATDSQGSAIGNVETVVGEAIVLRQGEKITLKAGNPVFEGDIIETETGGSVKLRFIDETVFSISEEARLALDKMVFNPETAEGESILSILKGAFLFISGQIAQTDPSDMQVVTPLATIGIRGTIVTGTISPGEAFEFSVVDGAIAVQPQGADEPIVMNDAFATLGGSISESGEITTQISQDSAREVIERNASQFATLSDADVVAIETAVTTTALQNGEAITLDLQNLIEEVVAEIAATDVEEGLGGVLDAPIDVPPIIEIDLVPVPPVVVTVIEPEPEPVPEPDPDPDPPPDPEPVNAVDTPVIIALTGVISRANAILSGTAQAGATIAVVGTLNGSTVQNLTTTATGGSWSVDLGADISFTPDNETYSYSVTATNSAGTTSDPATTDVLLDFVAPDAPTLNSTLSDGKNLTGTSTGEATSVTVALTAGDKTITYDNIVPADDGTWSVDLTTNSNLDQSGATSYNIVATAKDAAGNVSTEATVDNISVDLIVGLPNASLAATGDQNALSVSGDSAEVGATVTIDLTDAYNNPVGSSQTATVDANGDWSVTFSDVLSGTYQASVTATDTVGNTTASPLTTSSYVAIYKEDWSNLSEGRSVNYSSTHTAGGVEITTSSHADTFITTGSNDIITSDSGNDTIDTSAGDDEITLTYGDYASGTPPTYLVNAGEGNDTLIVSDQAFDIYYEVNTDGSYTAGFDGGAGSDTLVVYNGSDTDSLTTGRTIPLSGFETIMFVANTEYVSTDDQKKMTMMGAGASNYPPAASFDLGGYDLTIQGQINGVETVTIENGMDVVWKDSNTLPSGSSLTGEATQLAEVTLSQGTDAENTELTLQANQRLDPDIYYFKATDSFTLEANTTLTLQANDNPSQAGDADMSDLLKVGGGSAENDKFVMDQDAKLIIDFLNLETNDLDYAKHVIDFTAVDTDDSADNLSLAGNLVIQANQSIQKSTGDTQTIVAIANDVKTGEYYSTFDEILFLDGSGNNLVTTGTVNALVPIFDMTDTAGTGDYGLKLKTVTAAEYVNGSGTLLTDSGAYYSTTDLTLSVDGASGIALYGSNSGSDTFTISSADQLAYFDGGSGDHNDTLKITGTEAIQFYDVYSDTGIMDFQVNRIETLDISENTAYDSEALILSSALIKALTEDTNSKLEDDGVTDFSHSLILKVGSDTDSINRFNTSGWTNEGTVSSSTTTYSVYSQDDTRVYIDTPNALGS